MINKGKGEGKGGGDERTVELTCSIAPFLFGSISTERTAFFLLIFFCFFFLSPCVFYAVPFLSHCVIDPDTVCRVWAPECLPVLRGKGGGSHLVPFYPRDPLFNSLEFLSGDDERLIDHLIDICSD